MPEQFSRQWRLTATQSPQKTNRTTVKSDSHSQSGVAIILVVFIIALASIIVVNLAYSSFLSARLNASVERSLQAEYFLKSALNVARILIQEDTTPTEDGPDDLWRLFLNGVSIPTEWLDIKESNVQISLEIRPEEARFPLRSIVTSSGSATNPLERRAQEILLRLFRLLGFDDDDEVDQSEYFGRDRVFNSQEMVGMLIDYMDSDKDSFDDPLFSGFEGDLPEDHPFPNRQITRIGELSSVPGFTADRVRRLLPFVTAGPSNQININAAPALLIRALHPDFDSVVEDIVEFRGSEGGPFHSVQDLFQQFLPNSSASNEVGSFLRVFSNQFSVLAKVDYSTSTFFMRAYVSKGNSRFELPQIQSLELF